MARTPPKLRAANNALVGKLVRLKVAIRTKGGTEFAAGARFRVSSTWRGKFILVGVTEQGKDALNERKELARYVRQVPRTDFELEAVQPEPKKSLCST